SSLIITDSGGVQEEAPSLGKRVLVTRETTERPEVLEAGLTELVGADVRRIVERAGVLLSGQGPIAKPTTAGNPYGDGHAATRIVDEMLNRFVAAGVGARLRIAA
ncbi:MAG: UDP-N-acetylglucosamine 2-epimerase, partial [Pirellulales bacterium]